MEYNHYISYNVDTWTPDADEILKLSKVKLIKKPNVRTITKMNK